MNITLHIKALLYRHDCVIVPGFGAFLAQFQSAKIDEEQNLFYPSTRSIRFNAQLQNNDGLLLNFLESEEGLNYVAAQNAIKDFVDDVNTTLAKQGNVVFKELGSFTYEAEKQLVFEPFGTNFFLSAFGLDSLSTSPVLRKTNITKVEEETKVIVLPAKAKNSNTYFKYAAVGLLAFGLAGVLGLNWYSNSISEHNLQVQNKVQQTIHSKIENADFSIIEPLPSLQIQTKTAPLPKNIHIVGGAFREEANAEKKLQQLQKQGFDAQLVGKNKYGLYQVAFSSFSDASEAKVELKKIQKSQLKSAWLLIQ